MLGVVVLAAVVAIVIVLATSGTKAPRAATRAATVARVERVLKGVPQSGFTLGDPGAPVTLIEYGDLICPACGRFALGSESQLIASDVRAGKVKILFRGFMSGETANAAQYAESQIAARAAGLQHHAWDYLLLFYFEQRNPAIPYVTNAYLKGVASQIRGLDLGKWNADVKSDRSLDYALIQDGQNAIADGVIVTPGIFVKGPHGTARFRDPKTSVPSLAQLRGLIARVS